MSTDTVVDGQGSVVESPSRNPLQEMRPARDIFPSHGPLLGTRSGLPTVLCYAASDLASISLALVVAWSSLWILGLLQVVGPAEPRLALGFLAAAMILNWYQGLHSTVVLKPAAELRQVW